MSFLVLIVDDLGLRSQIFWHDIETIWQHVLQDGVLVEECDIERQVLHELSEKMIETCNFGSLTCGKTVFVDVFVRAKVDR